MRAFVARREDAVRDRDHFHAGRSAAERMPFSESSIAAQRVGSTPSRRAASR